MAASRPSSVVACASLEFGFAAQVTRLQQGQEVIELQEVVLHRCGGEQEAESAA
jgi:hypothetical protein